MTDSKKTADKQTDKVEAAPLHETQNEHEGLPEHVEGISETPEEVSEAIVNPPEPNDDEVDGADNTDLPDPHPADSQADPREADKDEDRLDDPEDEDRDRLRLKRVSGDEVFGALGTPPNTHEQLADIRKRANKSGEVS